MVENYIDVYHLSHLHSNTLHIYDGYHRGLQARRPFDRQIDRPRRFVLDPVAEPAQRAVGADGGANAGSEDVEGTITVANLNHRLDLGAVLVVVAQGRQCSPLLAIAQDQQPPPAGTRSGRTSQRRAVTGSAVRMVSRRATIEAGLVGFPVDAALVAANALENDH